MKDCILVKECKRCLIVCLTKGLVEYKIEVIITANHSYVTYAHCSILNSSKTSVGAKFK